MEKKRGIPGIGSQTRSLIAACFFIVAVGFWSWTAVTALADDKNSTGKPESGSKVETDQGGKNKNKHKGDREGDDEGDAGSEEKCIVCHNPHNFHEISVPCDQVDRFLQHHPGDFSGHCAVTPHTSK